VIGVGRDAELAGSLRGRGAPNIITVGIEPSEALFLKQIDRAPMRLFVNAHVGAGHSAGCDCEPVVAGEVAVAWIE
jgi:hypothetical protein